jgi:predicted nucleic acid-binding protein
LTDRPCVAIDREPVIAAARVAERYQIHYWDSAIIVAAMRLGATILYTEYLNHGQTYGSVKAVNPFVPN